MADLNLLGVGIYSVKEAARISRVPEPYIRRWLWGYKYVVKGEVHHAAPLWQPQLPTLDEAKAITFRDLIEVQFVYRFRQQGLSLQSIRRTIGRATKLLEETYPLSSVKFKTDGRNILAEVLEDPGEKRLIFDLETGQYLLEFVFDLLYDGLEYSELDALLRWWPLGKNRRVVVDPKRSFGRPIVPEGVQTNILERSFRSLGSVRAVAQWYEVKEGSVQDALEFERRLAAA